MQTLPDYAPPWVMPLEQPSVEFTLRVLNEAAIAPEGHGLSKTQLQCAKEAALAEVDRLDLHLEGESIAEIRVTETIIDTAREWVCEGPRSEAGGTWTITALSTSLNFDATPPPVKLSPKECLARSRQQAIRQGLIPVVIMNTLLLPPIVIAIISAYF